jgi:hypothetical protein
MKEEFYILEEDWEKHYAEAIYKSDNPQIEICELCKGRRVTLTSNLQVYFEGKKKADYYSVTQYSIISENMYNTLKENNITDFNTRDIHVTGCYDARGNKVDFETNGLREMIILGECGYLRKTDGNLIKKCEKCGRVKPVDKEDVIGLKISIDEWDGSDIFQFKNFKGVPIVTQKVKDILEKSKIKNVTFINIKDYKLD